MGVKLHRYWIKFDTSPKDRNPPGITLGCGVTAYNLEDALKLAQTHLFKDAPLPPIQNIIEDVDVSTLDANHVLPNMGVPVWRGIWFPRLTG